LKQQKSKLIFFNFFLFFLKIKAREESKQQKNRQQEQLLPGKSPWQEKKLFKLQKYNIYQQYQR